jgi:hypothetical protein
VEPYYHDGENKNTMMPNKPTVLEGKALEKFEAYENSAPTKEELDWAKEARKHYKSHQPKINSS